MKNWIAVLTLPALALGMLWIERAVIADQGEAAIKSGLEAKRLCTVADLVAWVASRAKGLRRIA